MTGEKVADQVRIKEAKERFEKLRKEFCEDVMKSDFFIAALRKDNKFKVCALQFIEEPVESDLRTMFQVVGFAEYLKESILDMTIRQRAREEKTQDFFETMQQKSYEMLPEDLKKAIREGSN